MVNAQRVSLMLAVTAFLAGCGGSDPHSLIRVWADPAFRGILPAHIDGHRLSVVYTAPRTDLDQLKAPDVVLADHADLENTKPFAQDLTGTAPVATDALVVVRRRPGRPAADNGGTRVAITEHDPAAGLGLNIPRGTMHDVQLFDDSAHALDYVRTRPAWSAYVLRSVLRSAPDRQRYNVRTPAGGTRTFEAAVSKAHADDGRVLTRWLAGDAARRRIRAAGYDPAG